jgi:uncharacterized protein (TIGR03118 family)
MRMRTVCSITVVAALVALVPASGAAGAVHRGGSNSYREAKLVADEAGEARHQDPNLVNAWGLAAGPMTPWWVADADANVSTIYSHLGVAVPLVVGVDGGPTGLVYNGGPGFVVSDGTDSGPSVFMFATEEGTIRGWNPEVPPPAFSDSTFVVVDRSGEDANYKGLAIASPYGGDRLYAADFHNARVDVFDAEFNPVDRPGAFEDPGIPAGFAPFGIQNIHGTLFVTYAKQDADAEDEVTGAGEGFVDAYSLRGKLLARVATRGPLNAPWGLALAPHEFGRFSGDLLVGNFGNGRINAFAPDGSGFDHEGLLRRPRGRAVRIDGLWALQFANGGPSGPTNALFFTAGPDDEEHGLFGRLKASS